MISLNLIPKDKKAELGLANFFITLKNIIILFLIITILVAISLLAIKAALQNHFNIIVGQSTLTTQFASSFNKGVQQFNRKVAAVKNIQNNYIVWTDFLIEFSKLIPNGTTINSIDVSADKILISGQAKDRQDLLDLEKNLKKSKLFTNVEVPLEDLLKKSDIDFNIKSDVNLKNT